MVSRLGIGALVVVLGALTVPAQPVVKRGRYYRSPDPPFEMWIPAGLASASLTKEDEEDDDYPVLARFRGETDGIHEVCIQIYPGSYRDPAAYIEHDQKWTKEKRPGAQLKAVGERAAGPWRAGICWDKGGRKADEQDQDLVTLKAGILYDTKRTIEIYCYVEGPRIDRAVRQLEWMLDTVRSPGERGLDAFLEKRRIDTETGLSYRPPRGLAAASPPEGAPYLYRGEGKEPRRVVTIAPVTGVDLSATVKSYGRGMVCVGGRRLFPHDPEVDAEVFGGLYRTDDKSRAFTVLAVLIEKSHLYRVVVEGAFEACDALLRTAELTATGLRWVDVEAARKRVEDSLARLAIAKKQRDAAAAGAAVAVLVRHPYLKGVPAALAGALEYLPDAAAIEAAAQALAEHGSTAQLPALLEAGRYYRSKHETAALAALVPALGTIRGKKAAALLFDLARRPEVEPAAAAVCALGHYRDPAYRAAKKLVSLMIRAEKAGLGRKLEDRERWLILQPIYVESLKRLTGHTFANAAEARAWLRK
jgi:hypothetical protein